MEAEAFTPTSSTLTHPFEIDGNFGFTSGVAEMLLQSNLEAIHLLPALPSDWPSGQVSGLRARGGHEISIEWKDSRLVKASVKMGWKNQVKVQYGDRVWAAKGEPGSLVNCLNID